MACTVCDLAMTLEDATIRLECNHQFHTRCFFRQAVMHNDIAEMRCNTCNIILIPVDILHEAEAIQGNEGKNEIIQYLWENEPDFKNEIVTISDATKTSASTMRELSIKKREIIKNFKEEHSETISLLKEKVRETKKAYHKISEYKAGSKIWNALQSKKTKFIAKWGVTPYNLRQALRNIPSAKPILGITEFMYRQRRALTDYDFNVRIS